MVLVITTSGLFSQLAGPDAPLMLKGSLGAYGASVSMPLFLGFFFGLWTQTMLHPGREAQMNFGTVGSACWVHYLQGIYISQVYIFCGINGSWLAALCHRMLGCRTPLDTQWYSD